MALYQLAVYIITLTKELTENCSALLQFPPDYRAQKQFVILTVNSTKKHYILA